MEQGQLLSTGLMPGSRAGGRFLLTPDVIRQRVQQISQDQRRRRGDHELSGIQPPPPPHKPAAVLVPIIERPDELTVLLTKRTDHLHDHAGQISFPGGRMEDDDPHPEAAALRESLEEIGLDARHVELVGRLDQYHTVTGYEVTPVVGLVRPPFDLVPDDFEVADIFEVPLSFIVNRRNHERHSRMLRGQERAYYVLPYQNRYIWGATAAMLVNLAQVLLPE